VDLVTKEDVNIDFAEETEFQLQLLDHRVAPTLVVKRGGDIVLIKISKAKAEELLKLDITVEG